MDDWTLEEARAYLPRLRQLLGVIKSAATVIDRAPTNGHGGAGAVAGAATGSASSTDAEQAWSEIEAKGIVVRDLGRGLVDFPARHRGRVVLLCWLLEEDDIRWWHLPEEGFVGRKPLPLPPDL